MADHRTFDSSEVHEPKHISSSVAADAGKVITPLSGGTSELRNLTPAEVGIEQIYGEMALNENLVDFSVAAAVDADLYDSAEYIALNSVRMPGAVLDESNGISFDDVNNTLIVPSDGVYRISFWVNVITDTNNTKFGIKAKENGTFSDFTLKQDIANLDRVANVHADLLTGITAGSPVGLWIASDKSVNLTILDARFSLELVRAL